MADKRITQLTAADVADLGALNSFFEVSVNTLVTPTSRKIGLGKIATWLATIGLAASNVLAQGITVTQGTITDPAAGYAQSVTWNDAADTFIAQTVDVTDTASAAASLFARYRVGGVQKLAFQKDGSIISAVGYAAFGASPPTSGAIRVDAASYGTRLMTVQNGTVVFQHDVSATAAYLYTQSAHSLYLGANNLNKWIVSSLAAGTSQLVSAETTARIVGGSTNGLADRNSANTRDNFVVADDGTTVTLSSASYTGRMVLSGAAGEQPAGTIFQSSTAGSYATLAAPGNPTGGIAGVYRNNADALWRSAWEVSNVNVAGAFGTLALMKSGGPVVIGTDPGGTSLLRVGGNITTNATLSASIVRVAGAASGSVGTVTFGTSTQTTVGAAGAASALPATPDGYLRFFIGSAEKVMPFYPQS